MVFSFVLSSNLLMVTCTHIEKHCFKTEVLEGQNKQSVPKQQRLYYKQCHNKQGKYFHL